MIYTFYITFKTFLLYQISHITITPGQREENASTRITIPQIQQLSSSLSYKSDIPDNDATEIFSNIPQNYAPAIAGDILDISEINPSLLGVLFPNQNTHTEALSEQFNLELLEDSLIYHKVENNDKQDILNIKVDILSDAISEIVKDSPIDIEKTEKVRKGRKRGRKLGYRSENSNGEDAVCGVCGAKVSTLPYSGSS